MLRGKLLSAAFSMCVIAIVFVGAISSASMKKSKSTAERSKSRQVESIKVDASKLGNLQDEARLDEDEYDKVAQKESMKSTSTDLDLVKGIVDRGRVEEKPVKLVASTAMKSSGSNINNAKTRYSSKDIDTAAGHHHHYKHSVSGWLDMGAHSDKKGAFGWHDKHPVGGKGRR